MANNEDIADVVVIGAGASGAAFTWSLAQAGINVVCLEQGGWVPTDAFPTSDADAQIHLQTDFHPDPGFRGLPADFAPANRTREVQAVSAAGMLARKEAFLAVGGFRTDAEGLESIDLCLKLRRKKGQVIYEPSAVLFAHHGPEWPESFHRLSKLGRVGGAWLDFIKDDLDKLLRRDGRGIRLPKRLSSR